MSAVSQGRKKAPRSVRGLISTSMPTATSASGGRRARNNPTMATAMLTSHSVEGRTHDESWLDAAAHPADSASKQPIQLVRSAPRVTEEPTRMSMESFPSRDSPVMPATVLTLRKGAEVRLVNTMAVGSSSLRAASSEDDLTRDPCANLSAIPTRSQLVEFAFLWVAVYCCPRCSRMIRRMSFRVTLTWWAP
jgi:hypothetical protein